MKARGIALAVALILAAPLAAKAQQAGKVWRIGYLTGDLLNPVPSPERAALLEGLREAGYVPGETIIIEYRSAALNPELLTDLAQELVDLKVDVIITVGAGAVGAARDVAKTIPIVVTGVADPVGAGFVASLARPGGNLTGQAFMSPELGGKRPRQLFGPAHRASNFSTHRAGALIVITASGTAPRGGRWAGTRRRRPARMALDSSVGPTRPSRHGDT